MLRIGNPRSQVDANCQSAGLKYWRMAANISEVPSMGDKIYK